LIIAAVGSAQRQAKRAGGVNSLRQIGTAINLHAQEHRGALPGPLWPGQVPYYETGEQERLTFYLAPYLDVPPGISERFLVEAMVPPAYPLQELAVTEPRTYIVNDAIPTRLHPDGANLWGAHPALAQNPGDSTPGRLSQISNPGAAWAVMDADQQHPRVSEAPWAANTPENPIHGNVRHALFFDGHVEAVDLTFGE